MTDPADRERITMLEAALADLRQELEQLRTTRSRSMRETLCCPVCGNTKILHFPRIKDVAHNSMVDLALQKEFSGFWGLTRSAGALETYACRNCRLVEWHVVSLDDVQVDGTTVIELDGAAEPGAQDAGPYR